MKYLDTLQDKTGNAVSLVGHTHVKSNILDMPTKLSQFVNDMGLNNEIKITTGSNPPINPVSNDFWYITDDEVILITNTITTSLSAPTSYIPADFWYKIL